MEKRDLIVIVIAILIVLIMAMYIKPLVTGKKVELVPAEISAIFGGKNESEIINETPLVPSDLQNASTKAGMDLTNISTPPTPNIMSPTPTPTWNGSPVQVEMQSRVNESYIYPRPYPEQTNQIFSFTQNVTPLISYTDFSGQYSAKTDSFYIPTGYWELWYTVDLKENLQYPTVTQKPETVETRKTGEKIIPERMDSVSVVNPYFSITVKNADSGSVNRFITPPGGLNPRLWKGEFGSPHAETTYDMSKETDKEINWDPRPWKEKFFEGYRNYQLEIDARNLISYSIMIKVPNPNASTMHSNVFQDQAVSQPSNQPGQLMEQTYLAYIDDVNGNISDPQIFGSIIRNLSQNLRSQKTNDDIFREISHMKIYGIILEGFNRENVFYRGPEGSLKGVLTYRTKIASKQIRVDIPFILEYDGWKMNDLPLVRT